MDRTRVVVVTGTGGYLGAAAARRLEEAGWEVRRVAGRAGFAAQLERAVEGRVDAMVHAGFTVDFSPAKPSSKRNENVDNTVRVADAARKAGCHLVFLDAAGTLGVSEGPRARNEAFHGTTDPPFLAYQQTRYIQDKLAAHAALRTSGADVAHLFLTTVFGRGRRCGVWRQLHSVAGPNPALLAPPGGTSVLELDDFLQALERVLAQRFTGGVVISTANTTYADMFLAAAREHGVAFRKRVVLVPPEAASMIARVPPALSAALPTTAVLLSSFGYKYYSPERARRELGWAPRGTLQSAMHAMLGT